MVTNHREAEYLSLVPRRGGIRYRSIVLDEELRRLDMPREVGHQTGGKLGGRYTLACRAGIEPGDCVEERIQLHGNV